ncbi:hypothetical protein IW261DRAFT_1573429 [Armillaria novae-zelandiae]|uniref:Uncharacterized protein n=1 Tax=Armillaria novae-zelandiae TaxID=153914 RepID=A0AA39NNT4_9AGAR|nr:hypothetical protein IW261DRAFT_1573429 [Armillaria novae-zelandiae]
MSTEGLVYSHKIPLDEFCCNLISAQAYAAWYFNSQVLFVSSAPELVHAVEDAHPYLAAYMDILHDFGLSDSHYGLALQGQIVHIVNIIPTIDRQEEWTWWQLKTEEFKWDKLNFDVSHCLPSEEEYTTHASHCVAENDLHPFWMHALPALYRPLLATSPLKSSADVAVSVLPSRPHPTMIRQPEPAREPAIPLVSTLKVEVHMLPSGSVTAGSLTACKRQHAPDIATPPSINLSQVKRSTRSTKAVQPEPSSIDAKAMRPTHGTHASSQKTKAHLPAVSTTGVTKKLVSVYMSDDLVESESGGEGAADQATDPGWDHEAVDKSVSEDVIVLPVKWLHVNGPLLSLPPPPSFLEPAQPLPVVKSVVSSKGKGKVVEQPSAIVSFAPPSPLTTDVVDNTIYFHAFHPSVDLQYHKPPSHQALESMKLSLLPATPDSLTKYTVAGNMSTDAILIETHILFVLLWCLNWPCFNCTLAGYLDQCVFEGGIREECCTKCKSSCHGCCSAHWDANQLHQSATLLDPLTLSGDGAICRGVQCVDHINSEIELLGQAMQLLCEDHEAVIGELADGLDAIACHEHGTEIIEAYSQVSGFLKSFIVHVGGAALESSNGDAEGGDD